ncbi:prolyl-tRNA synthetase associated domain-containing protein [Lacrimispora sp. JR3]|uniref:prolyl-tRNA synthetase associated domain-containing protein n=1 Tax=Lacrimispora sinapis TaxID=3111456 RepID=UPI003747B472
MADLCEPFFPDKTIYNGRPSDLTGRLDKEIRAYDRLDRLGIHYQRLDHSALPTIESCREVDILLQTEVCKNLFLCNAQRTDFYLLLLPGAKKFRTAVLSKQIGSARLTFAEPEFMEKFLDITPGSVSVMGLMNDKDHRVRLLIDREVLSQEYFACHPCINTSSLKFKTSDLLNKFLPAIDHDFTLVDLPYAPT